MAADAVWGRVVDDAMPDLASRSGSGIVLVSDDGLVGPRVLAFRLGPTLYATDVYRQPETLRTNMRVARGAVVAFGLLLIAVATWPRYESQLVFGEWLRR